MATVDILHAKLNERFSHLFLRAEIALQELTLTVPREQLRALALVLRDDPAFAFDLLVDVCGIDYLQYGIAEWETEEATATGFERGVMRSQLNSPPPSNQPRFAAVYHLLSLSHNHRIRLRVFAEEADLVVPSVVDIWPAANWFEREAFDLFGIIFDGHPDLRRILTDYGFVGHPFRKDFPLIGNVEVRYDAKLRRVVYEPVNITARVLEPKVIRSDNRYESGEA